MPGALPLLHGQISLSAALDDDDNVLQELSYPQRRIDFYTCRVEEVKEWISGSFNVCIPVVIDGQDENESVPTDMDRDLVYSTSDSYYMDLLSYHDSRLRHVPNSIRDKADGEAQLSSLTIMRALLPHFSCRKHRRGPFIMTLTDLHQSNLFVDSDWNIKSLIDLEWTCSRPVEMLHPPYWLTSRGVDQLYEGEHLDAFSEIHAEFMEVFDKEEQNRSQAGKKSLGLASIMRRGWATGSFWYFHALETPKGLYNIFLDHIQPRYSKLDDAGMVEFERTVSPYWTPDIQTFLDGKLKEKEIYEGHLRDAFSVAQEEPSNPESPPAS
ncbi:hypothetical protein RIB2604_02103950 [Aspergillus luchuensis]|uniref:Aminoglycoside phosphotransferase domain-containing protein n=1 Tax=Aspergillus kawachii TaxID=1069201 RepID=A0A146FNL6_ASPKA|nr:hypothetical protein RIB2604_02103950 [Aspergillus luchuensis]